jgi:biopolymer transport protein ExbD|tara:strand:+ start:193 stop:597 length:405 start_codon:yes stop_codon:yes gene_type:complete
VKSNSLRPVRRRRVEINIVPLIDVLVVLVFFFLVTMRFRDMRILQLTLPEMETAGESARSEFIELAVTKEGVYYYNSDEVDQDELIRRLVLAAQVNNQVPVLITADEASLLKDTTTLMDACRKQGLENIRLQTK